MKKIKITIELEVDETNSCEEVYIYALEKFEEALVKQEIVCDHCRDRSSLMNFILSFIASKVYQNEQKNKEQFPDVKDHNLKFILCSILACLVAPNKEIFNERFREFTSVKSMMTYDNPDMVVVYLPVSPEQISTDAYHRVSYAAEQFLPSEWGKFTHIFIAFQSIVLMWEKFTDKRQRQEEVYKLIESLGKFSSINTNQEFNEFMSESMRKLTCR